MQPTKLNSHEEPELKTRTDVDRAVIDNLSATDNPHNEVMYDLAGKRPITEKIGVILRGFSKLALVAIVWVIGESIGNAAIGPNSHMGMAAVFLLFAGYIFIPISKTRWGMRQRSNGDQHKRVNK